MTTTLKCCDQEHPANGVKCCVCGKRRPDYVQKDELVYLAAPYTNIPPSERFFIDYETVTMIKDEGLLVFSPISYSGPRLDGVADGLIDWYAFDLRMLRKCDKLVVLMLDGWRESKGVGLEIAEAERLGMPIEYREA